MTPAIFVYWKNYSDSEEQALARSGVGTARLSEGADPPKTSAAPAFLRAGRMTEDEFALASAVCERAGYQLITSQKSFSIAGDFERHYPLLKSLAPKAVTASSMAPNLEIARGLRKSGLKYPIFVRSDRESAAKYVGIEGCIVRDDSDEALEQALENLRTHVKGFRTIIFKELVPLKKTAAGRDLEYRAIGVAGTLLMFDYSTDSGLPAPESVGVDAFAARAIKALAAGGADGALFVDVAVTEDGERIVVECKDFSNGTIKNLDSLAAAVKAWRPRRAWRRATNVGFALAAIAALVGVVRRLWRK